jgi:hypothetical protein
VKESRETLSVAVLHLVDENLARMMGTASADEYHHKLVSADAARSMQHVLSAAQASIILTGAVSGDVLHHLLAVSNATPGLTPKVRVCSIVYD